MVETYGEKKQGIGINYKGQWGYHPLVVTLAETQEMLYIANRSGNRPSHEDSAMYFNSAIDLCKEACLLYTSPSPRDGLLSRMPSSA